MSKPIKYMLYHKDGTVWAKGSMLDDAMHGNWEWFRKDGTKMRSGSFSKGTKTGEWITYDKKGKVYKKTTVK